MSTLLLPHSLAEAERDACGVGFAADRHNLRRRYIVERALTALAAMEHRGACLSDRVTGDGTGIMTEIPWDLLGVVPGEVCVATLFLRCAPERRARAFELIEQTFAFFGLEILRRRAVPTRDEVLGPIARELKPEIFHLIIRWPAFARRGRSLAKLLYLARQKVGTVMRQAGFKNEVFFTSLSATTIVYKALTRAGDLAAFYPDLQEPAFKSRFALFHRRFSTNTRTSWDKAQPFRVIAHNGEINTIAGNRSSSYSREQALGLPKDELLTHAGMSDSGSLNEMCEALKYRSGIPGVEDVLAILIPPPLEQTPYYRFWSRAVEPWDGPALVAFSDGRSVGARLDRNGFRPCRWAMTEDAFYVASEAGVFGLEPAWIEAAGTLAAGHGVKVDLGTGEVHFRDPSESRENAGATFEPRLLPLPEQPVEAEVAAEVVRAELRRFGANQEDLDVLLLPMVRDAKEPIGSMGDTTPLAVLSDEPRSFYDFFFQTFAQVTNPPLDYLRERMVTDLSTFIGKRPNIFQPREMLPPTPGILLDSPLLSLGRLAALERTREAQGDLRRVKPILVDTCFRRDEGARGLRDALARIDAAVIQGIRAGGRALILTDRAADNARLPVPSLLALRAAVQVLNREGVRLSASIVVDGGDALTSHHVAALISFGATAVCPRVALRAARAFPVKGLDADSTMREARLLRALESGLLKIMSKMGISVVRSYESSKLFCAVGLGPEIIKRYFRGLASPVGGLRLADIAERLLQRASAIDAACADPTTPPALPHLRLFRESKRPGGERHAMSAARAKIIHSAIAEQDPASEAARAHFDEYLAAGRAQEPVHLRHVLRARSAPIGIEHVEDRASLMTRFGSGAMSFGAISADSQRDIFLAMRAIGGRSNSGEGGENPHYFVDGTTASTKQVASGRFGVTAEYLVTGQEIEIKIAQGAKPGEGGQLMATKVDAAIARARHASPGVDLISPPPQHDIYSIEDLKGLIYELKQLAPSTPVVVKLVSGVNIGTIAVGVVKAGADVVQISGGDGGTGAATLISMKHAGLPWELGLAEAHHALSQSGLRGNVKLRADGGLSTGHDVLVAALLGADEVGFGKLMLIGAGCIMARICEKNTCPRGIATHAPRFLAKYRGKQEEIERLMALLADDLRRELAAAGLTRFADAVGRADLLEVDPVHEARVVARGLDLRKLCAPAPVQKPAAREVIEVNALNQRIVDEVWPSLHRGESVSRSFDVRSTDRGVLARLAGQVATRAAQRRRADRTLDEAGVIGLDDGQVKLTFRGSAGQGFGMLCQHGFDVTLEGEANDSVAKSMSGGRIIMRPPDDAGYAPADCAIIGNSALYGATGGTLLVYGHAGDRFAVRNSGATAVVEGVGMHACGYMTGGLVVILGPASHNVGSGMTGGRLIARADLLPQVSAEYLEMRELDDEAGLRALLERYHDATGSVRAATFLEGGFGDLRLFTPRGGR